MTDAPSRVLIAGGGTGGHVFPMIAVGEALARERPDVHVTYVGTGRGIEARVVPGVGGVLEDLAVVALLCRLRPSLDRVVTSHCLRGVPRCSVRGCECSPNAGSPKSRGHSPADG